jgi:hypothetical protein
MIITELQKLHDTHVKHFKTDFGHDERFINERLNDKARWYALLRECGSHLIAIYPTIDEREEKLATKEFVLEMIKMNEHYYSWTGKNWKKETDIKEQLFAAIDSKKEIHLAL